MSENTFISILKANRLMRSDEEVTAFEKALFELAKNPQKEYLPELYLVLDDQCQHQEVMFSLIHFLESFEVEEQLQALLNIVPKLIVSAPEWTKIIHERIFNDEPTYALYKLMLNSVKSDTQNVVLKLIQELVQERQTVNA